MENKTQLWQLQQKATRYHKLPSELVGIADEWTAYQFDNAVFFFVTVLENALQEREEIGIGAIRESRDRYTLAQLLDPEKRLPRPVEHRQASAGAQLRAMAAMARRGGVKLWSKPRMNIDGTETRPQ